MATINDDGFCPFLCLHQSDLDATSEIHKDCACRKEVYPPSLSGSLCVTVCSYHTRTILANCFGILENLELSI